MLLLTQVFVTLLLVAGEAAAAITKNAYNCTSFMLHVPVNNVTTVVPPFPPFADQYAATSLSNSVTEQLVATDLRPGCKSVHADQNVQHQCRVLYTR
jgi:hypothetical protein